MADNTGSKRGLRVLRALAAALGVAVVTAACGGSSASAHAPASLAGGGSSALSRGQAGYAVKDCLTLSECYGLRQFRVAYGIQPLLDKGIDGRGETVVLPELAPAAATANPPAVSDVRGDLARFDGLFGLPVARLQVVNSLARSRNPWLANTEEVGDAEMVHALAPQAAIHVILISDTAVKNPAILSGDVAAALRAGLTGGTAVISVATVGGEQCFTSAEVAQVNSALEAARSKHVTVVTSSGDLGAAAEFCPGTTYPPGSIPGIKGVSLLASDPLVLAAGGTSLEANRTTGAYLSETVWNTPPNENANGDYSESSGGGFSRLFPRPAYQAGVPGIASTRGVPDVAADADLNTGLAVLFTDIGQYYYLEGDDGTSAAAPLWAAVIALADQYAGRHLGFVNPAIYQIGRSAAYHTAFHEITSGTNTVHGELTITGYQAKPGWNPATGWGSPNAQILVPLLARTTPQ